MRARTPFLPLALAAALALAACGGGEGGETRPQAKAPAGQGAPAAGAELTPEQVEKGIGPVTSVELGPVDEELAEDGQALFETKCSACHQLDARYVGPPLGDVLQRRTPEYVMNMILNSQEMIQKHPVARQLLTEYFTQMPNQGLTEQEARAVLEYLRTGGAVEADEAEGAEKAEG